MIRGGQKILHEIVIPGVQTGNTLAAALLLLVGRQHGTLDIAAPRQGNDHILVRNEVFNINAAQFIHEHFRAAGRSIGSLDFIGFIPQYAAQNGGIFQNGRKIGDKALKFSVFVLKFVALQAGEALQAHVQNALGLDF